MHLYFILPTCVSYIVTIIEVIDNILNNKKDIMLHNLALLVWNEWKIIWRTPFYVQYLYSCQNGDYIEGKIE